MLDIVFNKYRLKGMQDWYDQIKWNPDLLGMRKAVQKRRPKNSFNLCKIVLKPDANGRSRIIKISVNMNVLSNGPVFE